MSQSHIASGTRRSGERDDASRTVVEERDVQELLEVLEDADCRAIIGATDRDALSAKEISERCDLPLSSTYRKLDRLTDAGLLEERTRIRRSGKHPSEYVRVVEAVVVSLDADMSLVTRSGPSK